jgi:hypothetical protein
MILFIEKTWPFLWLLAIILILRWFHNIPRGTDTIDPSPRTTEIKRQSGSSQRPLTPSRGFGL